MNIEKDNKISGFPWTLTKDDGVTIHFMTEEKAIDYRDWLSDPASMEQVAKRRKEQAGDDD